MLKDLPLLLLCIAEVGQVFGRFATIGQHDHTEHEGRGDQIMEDRIASKSSPYRSQGLADSLEIALDLLRCQRLNLDPIGKRQLLRLRQILHGYGNRRPGAQHDIDLFDRH